MGEKVIPIRSVWLLRLVQRKWGEKIIPIRSSGETDQEVYKKDQQQAVVHTQTVSW